MDKRQVAVKINVAQLSRGKYVKQEGWNPNYVDCQGKKVSRANIIGVIISKEKEESYEAGTIDDGTGKITARDFEKKDMFRDVDVGDIVLLIGRPREYGGEKYIVPEIIKKIREPKWVEVRKKELEESFENKPDDEPAKIIEEEIEDPYSAMISLIESMDEGEGADYEKVMLKSGSDDPEKVIKSLIEEGDLFEVRPGKLKVLK